MDAAEHLELARLLQRAAAEDQARRDEHIRAASTLGVSMRQIAASVGLSHQRIAQIIQSGGSHGS